VRNATLSVLALTVHRQAPFRPRYAVGRPAPACLGPKAQWPRRAHAGALLRGAAPGAPVALGGGPHHLLLGAVQVRAVLRRLRDRRAARAALPTRQVGAAGRSRGFQVVIAPLPRAPGMTCTTQSPRSWTAPKSCSAAQRLHVPVGGTPALERRRARSPPSLPAA